MHDPNHNVSPFNAIPPVIVALVAVIVVIEVIFQLGASGLAGGAEAIGWRISAIERFGFFDQLFEWMRRTGQFPFEALIRFVTYPFLHYEAMHAIFAAVLLLAIGKFVAERYHVIAVLVIFFASSVAGALGYGFILNTQTPLIGAYPGVYGLMGAFTWSLFVSYEAAGENRLKAFQLIGMLIVLQLIFKLIGDTGNDWLGDLVGFIAGFLLAILLAPGGIGRALSRLRQR